MKQVAAREGQINHYIGVRMRVTGSASMQMRFLSLDEVVTSTLLPLTITPTNSREPFRKANFKQQRIQLEIKITTINEYFEISKIVIFSKPSAASYPG